MRKTIFLFAFAALLLNVALWFGGPPDEKPAPVPPRPAQHLPTISAIKMAPSAQASLKLGQQVQLAAQLSHSRILAHEESALSLLIDVEAASGGIQNAPRAVAIVIDRSGSMAGENMDQARAAAKLLASRLTDRDMLAVVSYSSDYTLDLPLVRLKGQRARINRTVDDILDGGGTNLAGGLRAGLHALKRAPKGSVRHLILLSDGNANQGITEPRIIAHFAQEARQEGITVATLGVGLDFNEDLLANLAQSGGGDYHYARDAQQIATAFQKEIRGLSTLAARQVEVSFELPAGVHLQEVFGYRTERHGRRITLPIGDLALGEKRRIMLKLGVSAQKPGLVSLGEVLLSYESGPKQLSREFAGQLSAVATENLGKVAGSARHAVLDALAQAEAAHAGYQAVRQFQDGRRAQALSQLRTRLAEARRQSAELKSGALQAQLDALELTLENLSTVEVDSDAAKDLVKREKIRARRVFIY